MLLKAGCRGGYREDVKKWAIFNQDKEVDRVSGATFNVLVVEQDWMPKE